MCLNVYANGYGAGAGTHVSVYVCLMRGEHDDQLKWPLRGDITVQLLSQRKDQGNVVGTVHFNNTIAGNESGGRVTSGEKNVGLGFRRTISHDAVESTTGTTQYLHNDCLKWSVTNIVLHSV